LFLRVISVVFLLSVLVAVERMMQNAVAFTVSGEDCTGERQCENGTESMAPIALAAVD